MGNENLVGQGGTSTLTNVEINIQTAGAKCDAVHALSGGSITSGANTFSDSSASFTAADVGKLFYIAGAGTNGGLLSTTIASYVSSTAITLGANSSITATSVEYIYGTDDSAVWSATMAGISNDTICTIEVPYARLSMCGPLALKNNTSIVGTQADGWAFQNRKRVSGLLLKPGSLGPAHIYGISPSVGNVQLNNILMDGAFAFQGNTVTKYLSGNITNGANVFSDSTANFTSADLGKKIAIYGAASNGSLQKSALVSTIRSITNTTTVVLDSQHPASNTITNGTYAYGFSTSQGLDGATTAASNVFSSASASFTSADVGKTIEVFGAAFPLWGDGTTNKGDGIGCIFSGTILSITNSTTIVMSGNADVTLTGAQWRVGTIHGIYQPASATSQDSMWDMSRMVVEWYSGHGIVVGNYQRAQRLDTVYSWQNLGFGGLIGSSDNNFQRTMFAQNGEDGLYINQSTNHFVGLDTFGNGGNGIFISAYGQMSSFVSASIDTNEKNGAVVFGKGVMFGSGTRFTSNSQCQNGLYSDLTYCRRYFGGVTNLNAPGNTVVGAFWALGSVKGYLPAYGIDSVGPYGIRGTGIQYDPTQTLFVSGSITSGTVSSLHQTSFAIESGNNINLGNNISFVSPTASGGTKFGTAANQLQGFWGATPVAQPVISSASLKSILSALGLIGIVSDTTPAYSNTVIVITPPASDVAYQNTTGYPMDIIVNGGTVTSISFSRDNVTYYPTGMVAGVVDLSANDYVKVVYTAAPTMTGVPR